MDIISLKSSDFESNQPSGDNPTRDENPFGDPDSPQTLYLPTPPVPRISNLKPALRDKDRVNVYINGKFAFSLALAQVVDFKLKVGTPVPPEDRKKYESASELGKLYTSTLEWVLLRPRSKKETRTHLVQKLRRRELENKQRKANLEKYRSDPEFRATAREKHIRIRQIPLYSEEDIDTVIKRLEQKGYLNDERFAEYYIENRNLKKGISRRQITLELAGKGIDPDRISDFLSASSRTEAEEIKKIIQKKRHKKTKDQLLRYLISRGFPFDLSKTLLSEFYEQDEEV